MPSVPEIAPDQDINPGTSALEFDPNEAYRELLAQLSDAMDDYQEAVEEFVFEGHDESGDVAKTLMGIADEKAKASNWIAPDEKRKKLRAAKKASMKATKKKSQNALAALAPNYRKTELLLAIRQKGKEVDALQAKVQKGRVKSAVARIEQGVPLVPSEMDVSITDRVDDATKAQWDKALRKRRRRENRKREGERSGDSEDPIFGNTKEQYKAKHTRKTPIEIPYPNLVQSERKTRIKLPKGKDRLWGRYAS